MPLDLHLMQRYGTWEVRAALIDRDKNEIVAISDPLTSQQMLTIPNTPVPWRDDLLEWARGQAWQDSRWIRKDVQR